MSISIIRPAPGAGGCGPRARGALVLVARAGALLLWPAGLALGQGDTKERSFIGGNDGVKVFDNQLMKAIADTLGNTYKTLHVVVSSCYSGGFADEAAARLQGKYSAAVGRDKSHKMAMQYFSNGTTTYKGETGAQAGNFTLFGWDSQYFKKLDTTPDASAKDLFDAATANEFDKGNQTANGPKFVQGNNGGAEKVSGAAGSVEAVMWDNFHSNYFYYSYVTLQKRGYSDNTKQNPRIDCAFQSSENRNFGGNDGPNGTDPWCWVDRRADGANMQPMLDGLKTRLNQDAGNKTAFVYFGGHGNTARVSADTLPNPVAGALAQGRVMTPGNATTSLALTPEFVDQLLLVSVDPDPDLTRVFNAGISLTTFSESYTGLLAVALDGLQVGTIDMTGSSAGGHYQLDISDAALQELAALNAFDSLSAQISFEFLSGTPASSFQLATEWDFEAGATSFYGVGLAAPSVMVIPAPGALVVLLTAGAARRRRSRPQTGEVAHARTAAP